MHQNHQKSIRFDLFGVRYLPNVAADFPSYHSGLNLQPGKKARPFNSAPESTPAGYAAAKSKVAGESAGIGGASRFSSDLPSGKCRNTCSGLLYPQFSASSEQPIGSGPSKGGPSITATSQAFERSWPSLMQSLSDLPLLEEMAFERCLDTVRGDDGEAIKILLSGICCCRCSRRHGGNCCRSH